MNYEEVLKSVSIEYKNILGDNLVGIYVHGSIALGCFNFDKSDIDYIVVVNKPLTEEIKLKLMNFTIELNKQAPSKGLEMSIVLKKYCTNFIYPTPFDLHFSNMHLGWYNSDSKDYLDSIKNDISEAKSEIYENPMYIILNLCRVLAYVRNNLILSKEKGGEWGLYNLDKCYHKIINDALYSYNTNEIMKVDEEEAKRFCDYMLKNIN